MMCRLRAYFAPGLPRPTKSSMTRHPASGYFFLSPPDALAPAAGAFAPAAGALAPAPPPPPAGGRAGGPARRTGAGRSRSRWTGSSGSRSRLDFFGVAGRLHDGHERDVFARQRPHAGGPLDIRQMQRVADLPTADIGPDILRNVITHTIA